jgi:branched-chain amino acid transport system substrate-binding protein
MSSGEVPSMRTPSIWARIAIPALAIVLAGCGPSASPGATGSGATATPGAPPTQGAPATPSGEPIVVGSSLSLTGAFAPTGNIHKIAGDMFVERLNGAGGLLGRQVEWLVLDDESDPAQVAGLYERLITQEEVDLIIGPYATPLILSAMAVAERYGYVMPQHTAVLAPLLDYDCQFPGWSIGPTPNEFIPNQLYDALESLDSPPETIAFVTNQSGSTDFVTHGRADVDEPNAVDIATERGLEVVADILYPPGNTEWSAIATQVRDANPDFVMANGLGVEGLGLLQAMEQLGYRPPLMFSLFPAPGPLLGAGELAEGHLSVSTFEPNEPILAEMGDDVRGLVEDFESRAEAAGLPYTVFETQATSSWTAWEILAAGVTDADTVEDQEAICEALHQNGVASTFHGQLTFDPEDNNFWPTTQTLKQIQDGDWVVVWPEDRAAAPLRGPAS